MDRWIVNSNLKLWILIVLSGMILSPAAWASEIAGRSGATLFLQYCAGCHGEKAQGRDEFRAPPLAQMPTWYVMKQLHHFKAGRRGSHYKDVGGTIMAASLQIVPQNMFAPISEWIAKQPRQIPMPMPEVDPSLGAELYRDRCMECHRWNATGDAFFQSPPLAGLPAWYLNLQLNQFRLGARGFAKKDSHGQKMVFNVGFIHSQEEQDSLVAHILQLQQKRKQEGILDFGKD